MRIALSILAILAQSAVLTPTAVMAQTAPDPAPADARQVCEAKADQTGITGDGRETYLRECEAGERLVRGNARR
ncbi:hypothetical protein [Methylobacterium nonmethylotrophicum]|uniref:PsiF repeat-containing protein n=1 Tax=Methylobacterium nonmethylotrophicum TaxID=1141884 RepID=A0A4Z0NV52_9HYPH|nr:hypothetical protein [Methylobacterium nonmethylotrophicum]TGE00804.1 hypothetical protein EU555_08685 [Methylobacterium nonmethylotrophicum]